MRVWELMMLCSLCSFIEHDIRGALDDRKHNEVIGRQDIGAIA